MVDPLLLVGTEDIKILFCFFFHGYTCSRSYYDLLGVQHWYGLNIDTCICCCLFLCLSTSLSIVVVVVVDNKEKSQQQCLPNVLMIACLLFQLLHRWTSRCFLLFVVVPLFGIRMDGLQTMTHAWWALFVQNLCVCLLCTCHQLIAQVIFSWVFLWLSSNVT